jgi:hypothetical protein
MNGMAVCEVSCGREKDNKLPGTILEGGKRSAVFINA